MLASPGPRDTIGTEDDGWFQRYRGDATAPSGSLYGSVGSVVRVGGNTGTDPVSHGRGSAILVGVISDSRR